MIIISQIASKKMKFQELLGTNYLVVTIDIYMDQFMENYKINTFKLNS